MASCLTAEAREGHQAAQSGLFPKDCPYIATSSAWAAWLYGYGLGLNNGPIHLVKRVSQSRGYTLRVYTVPSGSFTVQFPNAKDVR